MLTTPACATTTAVSRPGCDATIRSNPAPTRRVNAATSTLSGRSPASIRSQAAGSSRDISWTGT